MIRWRPPVVRPPLHAPWWARYGFAVASTAAAAGLNHLLGPVVGAPIFLVLMPAVVLTAWFSGFGPAALASLLVVGLADFLFFPPVGALVVHYDADILALTMFLGVSLLISSSVESLRTSWTAAERAWKDEALRADVSTALSGSPGYRAAFQRLVEVLVAQRADYAVAYVLEDDERLERVGVAHADPDTTPVVRELLELAPPDLRSDHGAGAVLRTGEPMLVTEIPEAMLERAAQGDAHLAVLRRLRPLSSIIVPLLVDGRPIGALALATSRTSGRRYGSEDLALIQDLAGGAALLLENERQREEARAARRQAERSERRAREVEEAGRILSASLNFERVLDEVARLMARALGDFAVVDLADGETIRRLAVAHRDPEAAAMATELKHRPPILANEGVARALRTRQVVVVNDAPPDALESAALDEEHLRVIRALGPHSFLVAPMIARDEVIGAITVASADPSWRYGEFEILFARKLAGRAAMAIDNARLYEQAQTAVRMREEVLGTVSHDMRNVVGHAKIIAHMLLDLELGDDRRQEVTERQIRVLDEAERLIEDLLDISRAEAGALRLERERADAGMLVQDALDTFRESASHAGVRLRACVPEHLPAGELDRSRTLRVLYNLLSNAVRHGPEGSVVSLAVDVAEGGELVFSVSDSGPGIPEAERNRLFERFWQSSASSDGTGLGLSIAKALVEAQGGRIWLEESTESGSTFCFTVPVAAGAETMPTRRLGGAPPAG